MSIKLTDTQLVMLSAAAQRNGHCLVAAPNVKASAARKIAGKLIASGLVKEIKAKPGRRSGGAMTRPADPMRSN